MLRLLTALALIAAWQIRLIEIPVRCCAC